ncbi:MAG: hypothetical protein KM312_07880 [Hydrogenibacillus schlegelii]|uniref:Uncharacterized protein n=1 Tax=Hydrogenibacillus schlegelii TaxID=1484 RepID=A0A947CZ82_HYDSH|nr:hypothetical protein [Hydrogenibacillus schlegelii]
MFEIILKVVLLCLLGFVILAGLAIIFGISLGIGWIMGSMLNAFWHIPMWLGMSAITITVAVSMIGPLVGWWEEKGRHSWAPILATLWMFDRMTKGKD